MNIILKSEKFDDWLSHLKDKRAKAKIAGWNERDIKKAIEMANNLSEESTQ